MTKKRNYIFGPVPSRRLGLSLGIDVIPHKVCTLDCIYCQVGATTEKTIQRREYVPPKKVLAELKSILTAGVQTDFITFSGSGEPTLFSRLGELIVAVKEITDIPVAILTNGTLLYNKDVRAECAKADIVMPSLDAVDEQTFQTINRPHPDISIEKLISGLVTFRAEFSGKLWLEVFLVEGVNTKARQIEAIADIIKRIKPDKVQLNTAVRPTVLPGLKKLSIEKARAIASKLGKNCEIIADFSPNNRTVSTENAVNEIISMLKRRPCSIVDICAGLGIEHFKAMEYIELLKQEGDIISEEKEGTLFFRVI